MTTKTALASLGSAILCIVFAGSATAQMPEEIRAGVRIEMEGRIFDANTLLALQLTVLRAPTGSDEVKGIVQAIDHAAKTMTIAGIPVDCSGDCFVAGANGRPLVYEKVQVGERAKAEGKFENDVIVVDYMKVKPMKPGASQDVDVVGRITKVDRPANVFVVNGINVQVTPRTLIELE